MLNSETNAHEAYMQKFGKHTFIICLAVLSSLLNLIRGGWITSGDAPELSCPSEISGLTDVVMLLMRKLAPEFTDWYIPLLDNVLYPEKISSFP